MEPYQFKNWEGHQAPVVSPLKPTHLAGGYGQLHYRMLYNAPSHNPRGVGVEVEKVLAPRLVAGEARGRVESRRSSAIE